MKGANEKFNEVQISGRRSASGKSAETGMDSHAVREIAFGRGNMTARGTLPLLTFPSLEATGLVRHGFTTREGGVSKGIFRSLNLSFSRGDDPEAVHENFRRVAESLGIAPDRFVFADQTHTANVRVVDESDAGRGITIPRDYTDVDGLITDTPGIVLSAFFADCVPLFFVDPEHRAIGLSHSGWRGTVQRMGQATVDAMAQTFGTRPEDLICGVGPCICMDCYEVSADVAGYFAAEFPGHEKELLRDDHNGKFHLDLKAANRIVLEDAGVPGARITESGLCTCCEPELLFSHRASRGRRGNLGAFLGLL